MSEVNAILTLAYRDQIKFLRDPLRIVSSLVFPLIFVAVLGVSMRSVVGGFFDYLVFTFTGVLAQTLFQSAAMGLVSVIEDRENDFSQEIFIAPISRYSIVFGKILGESLVAISQGLGIILIGIVLGVPLTPGRAIGLIFAAVIVCLFGGAFGLAIMASLKSQRAANQVFPFIMLPQFFLAGVFTPVQGLPFVLDLLSRLSPMRYAVDLVRGVFYVGHPDYERVVLESPAYNLVVMVAIFVLSIAVGTWLFVRAERNR